MPLFRHLRNGIAAAMLLAAGAPALAQEPDPAFVFVVATAERGLECGLLAAWESAVIATETGRMMVTLSDAQRRTVADAAAALAEATPCDDISMTAWITASRDGILHEWLSPHLALFHALAAMEPVPALFASAVGDADLGAARAAIEAQFAAFAGERITPEGAPNWQAFQQNIAETAIAIVAAAEGGGDGTFTQAESILYIEDAAAIVLAWLETQG